MDDYSADRGSVQARKTCAPYPLPHSTSAVLLREIGFETTLRAMVERRGRDRLGSLFRAALGERKQRPMHPPTGLFSPRLAKALPMTVLEALVLFRSRR